MVASSYSGVTRLMKGGIQRKTDSRSGVRIVRANERGAANLFGEGNDIALETRDFVGEREFAVDLVQVRAHAQQSTAAGHRRDVRFLEAVASVDEVLYAIGAGEQFAPIESVDKKSLFGRSLKTAEEMPGHADSYNWEFQAASDSEVNGAKADGVAGALVYDAIEIAVLRVVVTLFVAMKPEFIEKVMIDDGDDLFGALAGTDLFAEIRGVIVEESLIRLGIDVRILRLCQEKRPEFDVQFFTLRQAKCQETIVGGVARQVLNDLEGATAENGIAAEGGRLKPAGGGEAVTENLRANRVVDRSIFVCQQIHECLLFALTRFWR
jgi:hypothetical protein